MISGSKKQLLNLTKRKGRISIEESVSETKLAKTTVREHFSQLEKEEYVEREFVRSGPGRPCIYFKLTQKGNSLFPSYEPDLMREFVKYLKKNDEESLLEDFFSQFWDQRLKEAEKLFEEHGTKTSEDKLRIIAEMLGKEGFMPEYKIGENESIEVRECNCPFTEVVKETRLPCKLEKEFISKLLNKDVERTSYIPDGDFCCNYRVA